MISDEQKAKTILSMCDKQIMREFRASDESWHDTSGSLDGDGIQVIEGIVGGQTAIKIALIVVDDIRSLSKNPKFAGQIAAIGEEVNLIMTDVHSTQNIKDFNIDLYKIINRERKIEKKF